MFKKLGIGILLIGAMCISGCSLFSSPISMPTPIATPAEVLPENGIYDPGMPTNAPIGEIWLSPGTFEIYPYYAGAEIKCVMRVHNGNSYDADYSILYDVMNADGAFVPANMAAASWVTVSDDVLTIKALSTEEVTVTLMMPEGAVAPADKWEFLICAKELGTDTMVQTRLCTKFKVTME